MEEGRVLLSVARSSAWRRAIFKCIDVVVDCEDVNVDGAMDAPPVAVTEGGYCGGGTTGRGGGGGGMRLSSDSGDILVLVSLTPLMTIPRSITWACSTEMITVGCRPHWVPRVGGEEYIGVPFHLQFICCVGDNVGMIDPEVDGWLLFILGSSVENIR